MHKKRSFSKINSSFSVLTNTKYVGYKRHSRSVKKDTFESHLIMTDRNTYRLFLFCVCAHGKIKLMREAVSGPTFRLGASCEIYTESKSQDICLENKTWNWAVDRELKKSVLDRFNGFTTRRVASKWNIWRFKVVPGFLFKEFSNCKQCLYFFEIYIVYMV